MLVVDRAVAEYPRFTLGPVTLTLQPGDRVALLGRNGTGKSTLLALMAGLRQPERGTVSAVPSGDDHQLTLRRDVAYVGAALQALPWHSVQEHFRFMAQMYAAWNTDRALALAHELALDVGATTGTLSRGNIVKLNLATAWGRQADILLLDEPTAGLDPIARTDLLRELRRSIHACPNAIVVYATHLLDELPEIHPTRLLVLRDGMVHSHEREAMAPLHVTDLTALLTEAPRRSTPEVA
ncbi:MAG: ATP-binding cassette domain-containing protein [Gemmatimonas sp.]|jgi:ABC-2 type transport system ATP-binding protein|uniref:ATP-binding cassette domain-containing protein n=1 Tax=Gemmatimonas sp. TaxID=1962908 RepID=UPI0022CCE081|nr:ATP-binding cassette domain-containing protein [Gemmatimonas sp.]MCA2983232.1 ATP-binding cassette domain-containing protein [Gemmatimonas sp.]MCA2985837.1 ATP-binding cassette domain-containing protein [Gemmatimonas sp.]MCA2996353.1 ATP-binding cassette domain-containing protein [Gemmatimonas sp.]MCE2952121.1 ATP-binding cassette domain-containing protein [Gemmatimonas sp.]MCZ8012797.1 ATP-binding cassette domain-containing protein [Gemmatimonas sp.]